MQIQVTFENTVRIVGKGVLASVVAVIIAIVVNSIGIFSIEDQTVNDWQSSFVSKPPTGQTVIVAVDQESLRQLGGYPIGRHHLANVLNTLNNAGVHRIFVDFALASEHNDEQDGALEAALSGLGPDRIALAINMIENENEKGGTRETALVSPLARFSDKTSLVMADISYGSDGLIRSLGSGRFNDTILPCNAATWLAHGNQSQRGATKVDFRIALGSVPEIPFIDIANNVQESLEAVRDKNIIVGIVASHVINTLPVPRFHHIHRTRFIALAAETVLLESEPKQASSWIVWLSVALLVIPLGFLLPRMSIIWGGILTVILTGLTMLVGIAVQYLTNEAFSSLTPLVALWLSYFGTLVATHSAFTQTRMAIKSFVGKVDHGLAKLFHSNVDSIVTFSPDGRILTLNETAEKLFNLKAEDVIGKSLSTILPGSADALLKAASQRQPGRLEATVQNNSGKNRHVDLAFNSVPMDSGWVGFASIRDISEFRAREDDLKRQATHDAMTGLPNRLAFEKNLNATLQFASETNRSFAVFLLDLNKFKQVNDTLGHHVGDALLIEVAQRLKQSIRNCDFACRLGGDEFAVVFAPPATHECAEAIAMQIVKCIGEIQELDGHKIETGSSVGVAFFPQHATTADELVRMADEAMYEAKRAKCGFRIAQQELATV